MPLPRIVPGLQKFLRQFPPMLVGEHTSVVVSVPQHAGKSRAGDGGVGFVYNGNQPPPENFKGDGVNF